jgi:type III restriction enzyme
MVESFYERPILNSPYAKPRFHHPLDEHGQPLDLAPVEGRRPSRFIVSVPAARRRGAAAQGALPLETYSDSAIVNEIRGHVDAWRDLPGGADWGVTPTTQRLLEHWRHHDFANQQPFFCQIEAVETLVWLTEVARSRRQYANLWRAIEAANADANPELFRLALKMATGAGKTTVMAMVIAWQTLNAVRMPGSDRFSRAFLIVTPGITIKDRLQVLYPEHPESYYRSRELLPSDMLGDIARATIVIVNYHAFQHRETMALSRVGRAFLTGDDPEPVATRETDGQMLDRACGKLLSFKNVVVLNDEAHHCYRQRALSEEERFDREAQAEARENNEAARLWISGIEALKRKIGVRAVYDLSATPFFLRGSGYREGTLFPWVVSDFSLMDAIECGIVKLPRIPVADNFAAAADPVYRNLWQHVGRDLLRTRHPLDLPAMLQTALYALYSNYEIYYSEWEKGRVGVPPVFIVVCQNTAISRLVYEWIAGFERLPEEDGERIDETRAFHRGALRLFANYDEHGSRLTRPNTLLIDSTQIEAGDTLEGEFRTAAAPEIQAFKEQRARERGAGDTAEPTDGELLREVMNTVGRSGRLGEQVRCVVSVSMLTEGWDANTVTHILGVRAFGTQLLCEQVVGRGLRRLSYEPGEGGVLFDVEYAQVMGIPFAFTASAVQARPTEPKIATHVHAVPERAELEISFPRVEGFRVDLPSENLRATFDENSRRVLDPREVGPCEVLMQGIVGEGITLTPEVIEAVRPSEISFQLAKHLLYRDFKDEDGFPRQHLFPQIQRICKRWLDEGYLVTQGVPIGAVLYLDIAHTVVDLIANAIVKSIGDERPARAVLDPYQPTGSTALVNFQTTRAVYATDHRKSHVSHVVLDSPWEQELARVLEAHPRVVSYAKNQGMQFEVPYRIGRVARRYTPDFLVRLDVGGGESVTLVLETKGYRGLDAQLKADAMRILWIPGVNGLGAYGGWEFAEFREVFAIQDEFARLVERLVTKELA